MHILTNISRGKGNQEMELVQLIEYTGEILFLKNHTKNMVEKLLLTCFLKNQN